MTGKIVIIGGGWSGIAAAVSARKGGADVVITEKTDLLLGLGNVGGIMRNNGRYTAAEENIALGAYELFDITDRLSRHKNISFPGHKHASLYDVIKVEPAVRRLLQEMDIEIRLMSRATDVNYENTPDGRHINSIITADGETLEGDVFIECTGSTGQCKLLLQTYRYFFSFNYILPQLHFKVLLLYFFLVPCNIGYFPVSCFIGV
jgi:NADPH-dependent 2,4-dienoyl-CoA reductase/sulfur reductase-like enzyme